MAYNLSEDALRELFFDRVFHYHPNVTLAIIAIVLFSVVTVLSFGLTWKYGGIYMWIIPAMGFVEVLGYGLRIHVEQVAELTPFIVSTLCLLMPPIAMALVNYIVAGKLLIVSGKSVRVFNYFDVRAERVAQIFFWGDLSCFFLQGAGGGMLSIQNETSRQIGHAVIIIGLVIQLMFFTTFIWILHRISTDKFFGLVQVKALRPVFIGLRATIFSLLIRNIFRLAEFASFPDGVMYTTEWIFYTFESIPVLISFVFYCAFHFGRLLESESESPAWLVEFKNITVSENPQFNAA